MARRWVVKRADSDEGLEVLLNGLEADGYGVREVARAPDWRPVPGWVVIAVRDDRLQGKAG